jgi:hypothetical protein
MCRNLRCTLKGFCTGHSTLCVKNLPHPVFIFIPLDAEAWLRKKRVECFFKKNYRYFDTPYKKTTTFRVSISSKNYHYIISTSFVKNILLISFHGHS